MKHKFSYSSRAIYTSQDFIMLNDQDLIQKIAPDITLQWLHNQRIAVFTVRTLAPVHLSVLTAKIQQLMDDCPLDRPFLCVQDYNFKEANVSPSVRQQAVELAKYCPELMTYTAMVIPKTFDAKIIESSIKLISSKQRELQIFFTVTEAIAWLENKL
jgi:hypothetical protein